MKTLLAARVSASLIKSDLRHAKGWSPSTKTIMAALGLGPVRAFGSLLCDANVDTLRGLSPIDVHLAIAEATSWLQANKATIERIDAGGSPAWDLVVQGATTF
jgi:hypothetical protein